MGAEKIKEFPASSLRYRSLGRSVSDTPKENTGSSFLRLRIHHCDRSKQSQGFSVFCLEVYSILYKRIQDDNRRSRKVRIGCEDSQCFSHNCFAPRCHCKRPYEPEILLRQRRCKNDSFFSSVAKQTITLIRTRS